MEVGVVAKGISRQQPEKPVSLAWELLTWDEVRAWCGARDLEKGRSYKRRVGQLAMTADGRLLGWVRGTKRYATTARLAAKGKPVSECSCPLERDACKHGVAVVLAFLEVLSQKKTVPTVAEDDPRWIALGNNLSLDSGDGLEDDEFDAGEFEDEDSIKEADEDFDDDSDDAFSQNGRDSDDRLRSLLISPKRQKAVPKKADANLREFLLSKPVDQLIELLLLCAARDQEFRAVLQEQKALQGGNIKKLIQEARREITSVTAEPAWSDSWDNEEDSLPNYSGVQRRLQTLLDAGHADAIVELGRELISRGLEQVSQSQDDGETAQALADSLEIVFKAVVQSSLSPCHKLIYAIEAVLQDSYDVAHHASLVLDAKWSKSDWSLVADELLRQLVTRPSGAADDWVESHMRERLSDWVIDALDKAGRNDEALKLCESEARLNGSYERLVKLHVAAKRWDDAECWACEGIANTPSRYRGIIENLKKTLSDIATQRKDWRRVAAFAAERFFEHPNVESFEMLMKAADRAKCREPVEAAARRFLETNLRPTATAEPTVLSSEECVPSRKTPRANTKGRAPKGTKSETATKMAVIKPVDSTTLWPLPELVLPVPSEAQSERHAAGSFTPKHHFNVLLDLALKAKQPNEVLRWFDMLSAIKVGPIRWHNATTIDQVATAVVSTYPERSLQLWNRLIDAEVAQTSPSHYEIAAGYLRKVRQLLMSLDRTPEWNARLASLREANRRKRRLVEIIDGMAGRPIVGSR